MPAHSMTDQQFHEIQLSGKQLVFVFMSAVVVAVVIFLLGVSVGRGVRTSPASVTADAGAPSDTVVPATPPAASKPGDLSYHDVLTGKDKGGASAASTTPPPATTPPVVAVAPPAAAATPPPAPATAATDAGASGAKSSPAATADTKPANAKASTDTKARAETKAGNDTKAPVTGAGWYLQFGSYNRRENADAHVQQLKAKGFSAFVDATTGPGPRYKVRMGPYADRGVADQQAARLVAAGQKPLVTR